MIFIPIAVAVLANVFYHVASKSISPEQNAFMGLVVNYATALLASAILFFLTPHEKILIEAAKTNCLHIDGAVDNGRGSRLRDDLSGERRTFHGVINREHFACTDDVGGRRIFLSRTNFPAKNFRRGSLHCGRRHTFHELKIPVDGLA